jgi:hypothetical protein
MEAQLKRRTFISGLGALALSETMMKRNNAWPLSIVSHGGVSDVPINNYVLRPFHVTLPRHIEALPYGSDRLGSQPAFSIRGIKGWAWSPEQYLAEIPIMAKYRLNFLMNCYSSLWELGPHGAWVPYKDNTGFLPLQEPALSSSVFLRLANA